MREMYLKVKKLLFQNTESMYYIFSGQVYTINSKTKKSKDTNEIVMCSGHFMALFVGDRFWIRANKFEHPIYGEQYQVVANRRILPGTLEEIEKFLMRHGTGIGPAKAKAIVRQYGLDTISKISDDIHALDGFKLPRKTITDLYKDISDAQQFESILIYLQIHRIDSVYANILYEKYGAEALNRINDNAYAPYLDHIWPFSLSERLHASLGRNYNANERLNSVVLETIHWDSEHGGNLFLPRPDLAQTISNFLMVQKSPFSKKEVFTEDELKAAIEYLIQRKEIVLDQFSNPISIYLSHNQQNEQMIAHELYRLTHGIKKLFFDSGKIKKCLYDFELQTGVSLAHEQEQGVLTALTSPLSIITGGPGTGKTHTIRMIIACIKALAPQATIKICAPTGKAAIRAEEMSGIPASTIHRLLKLHFPNQKVEKESLNCEFLIVDEFSMVDAYLCARLLFATDSATRIIIVGDSNQLPSVGPGLVLRDFIKSKKINTVQLTKVFRQAQTSLIVKNANKLICQNPFQGDFEYATNKTGDFYFIESDAPSSIRAKIQSVVNRFRVGYHMQIDDIQILSPIRRGALGVESLNNLFQELFLPKGSVPSVSFLDKEFRLGDKVIHIKNNSTLGVYNGEVGRISKIDYQSCNMLTVSYPDGKDISYSLSELEELELAYAITVHKSQGSEFSAVIIPVHQMLLAGMNLAVIYTALTRAKKKVVFVGNKQALLKGLQNNLAIENRRSRLVEKINNVWTAGF